MPLHHTLGTNIYDLLVICIPVFFIITLTHEMKQNLYSRKYVLVLHDTSPSFTPLSSKYWHIPGSLLWNCMSTPYSRLLQIFSPSFAATCTIINKQFFLPQTRTSFRFAEEYLCFETK